MIIQCTECKSGVSEYAEVCPHCGIKNPSMTADARISHGFARHVQQMQKEAELKKNNTLFGTIAKMWKDA